MQINNGFAYTLEVSLLGEIEQELIYHNREGLDLRGAVLSTVVDEALEDFNPEDPFGFGYSAWVKSDLIYAVTAHMTLPLVSANGRDHF